ncbi:L-gulonolactone oxidase-like [Cyanistes caeruleus]|uniref:L-gulonolactone oxidase-like n=1 Tax=Cyanistes caeruleus TaxID=156563 RepID=UPI000CDA88AF|nr:L-gulonolactone oxidase-like [Cyanistes caeruleus]
MSDTDPLEPGLWDFPVPVCPRIGSRGFRRPGMRGRIRECFGMGEFPVLEGLEQHLSRSQYFRFLWFPRSDNVRIVYQDPTQQISQYSQYSRFVLPDFPVFQISQYSQYSQQFIFPDFPGFIPGFHSRCLFPVFIPSRQVLEGLEQHLSRSQYFRFLWFPHSDNVRIVYQDPTQQAPRSSSSWFWDYAVGFYLLEFLLWISSFFPGLVVWINRVFFRLLFNSRVENVDRSHRILTYECRFRQHVQDWAIPIGRTKEALLELRAALEGNPGIAAHFPVEIRFSRRDEILLSPCFRRDSCFINVILYRPYGKDIPRFRYWELYEGIMRKHGGRPHWAKAHSCTRKELELMYPEFPKFCAIREKLDPHGIFLNAYLEKVFC